MAIGLRQIGYWVAFIIAFLLTPFAHATVFDYSNTSSIAIPDGVSSGVCGATVTRTISISDSYTIADIDAGLIINHTYNEDIRASLTSPNSTTIQLFAGVFAGGDGDDFNVRLDDEATAYRLANDQESTASYPDVESTLPTNSLSAFDGENVNGTWTLSVCDDWPADTGTIEGFYLHINDGGGGGSNPLIVTSTADTNTIGTLRYAINHANTNSADDAITFNISGLGPHVIAPSTALPTITDDDVSIDASTQGSVICDGAPNATGGMSNRKHYIVLFGSGHTDNALNISGASNVTIKGLTIGNSAQNGLYANNANGLTLLCNHFGASTDTTSDIGNSNNGARIVSSSTVTIGDGTLAGANIFGFNGIHGLEFSSVTSSTVTGNFIGVNATGAVDIGNISDGISLGSSSNISIGSAVSGGGNTLSGNGDDGIDILGSSDVTLLGNYVGTNSLGSSTIPNGDEGIVIRNSGAFANIGDGTEAGQNIIAGNVATNIYLLNDGAADINNNLIGVGATEQTLGGGMGIDFFDALTSQARNNVIAHNTNEGIQVRGTSNVAIYANQIFDNGGLGINLSGGSENVDDVNLNDSSDADTGPNDILNFPVINEIGANGTTSLEYDISLDVPTNTPGYRIDFFKNTTSDSSGHGEGEIYLGTIDVTGTGNHTGTFTAGVTVSAGDIISTTTTRKTASSFDMTSEFSETVASISSVSPLVVTSVADTNTLGTLRHAINNSSANDTISFNIPGAGPHVISPTSSLPNLSNAGVTIDGETQPGASCGQLTTGTQHELRIQIDGTNAGALVSGLQTNAQDVTFRGLSITNFDEYGVGVSFGGDNFTGECLYVGVAADGTTKGANAKASNRTPGVRLFSVANGTVRNSLISGNDDDVFDRGLRFQSVTDGIIEGNIIGLNATSTAALGNGADGILLDGTTSGISVGGTTAQTRNIISGNGETGIEILENVSNITILGNYIGLGTDGSTGLGNSEHGILASGVTNLIIGDGTNNGRNLISSNGFDGVRLTGTLVTIDINGNFIGVADDGETLRGNGQVGIHFPNNLSVVSDGAQIRNNVITDNDDYEISANDAVTNLNIMDNMIGMDSTGATILSEGGGIQGEFTTGWNITDNIIGSLFGDGVRLNNGTAVLKGNNINTDESGTSGLRLSGGGPYIIGGTGSGEGNIIEGGASGFSTIVVLNGASANIIGNTIRNSGQDGIQTFGSGSSAIIHSNTITNSGRGDGFSKGVAVGNGTTAAIYANEISNSGGLGIDLDGGDEDANFVTANDSGGGDADLGPNDLLNFPIINAIEADGSTSFNYDLDLDLPANTNGYRIDFFKNGGADISGHGESETYLGFIETGDHAGGNLNFTGSFTAIAGVSSGDIISTTTTRKTASLTYDITSEFSQNILATDANPASLVVAKSVAPLNSGDYALPGNDVIYTFSVTNEGDGVVDTDSILLIDSLPPETIFFYGDHDGSGPSTDIVGFSESATTLNFDPANDAKFSDDTTRPTDLSECDYAPSSGYDEAVKYVCFNPKGQMQGGDPDPNFSISFRARIR